MHASSGLVIPVRKRLRFKEEDDIALLREVAGQNPFQNTEVWEIIKKHVFLLTGKDFSIKTLKDHLDLLIKLWLEKKKLLEGKSGIEEAYTEKDQLCQDIFDSMRMTRGKGKKQSAKKKTENMGKASRDYWANELKDKQFENIVTKENYSIINIDHEYCANVDLDEFTNKENQSPNPDVVVIPNADVLVKAPVIQSSSTSIEQQVQGPSKVLCPIRSRKRKANIQKQGLAYLERYDKLQLQIKQKDQELEEKKLALEERKVAVEEKKLELQERKLALEEQERRKYFETFEQQRQDINHMIIRQDKIIELVLSKNL